MLRETLDGFFPDTHRPDVVTLHLQDAFSEIVDFLLN